MHRPDLQSLIYLYLLANPQQDELRRSKLIGRQSFDTANAAKDNKEGLRNFPILCAPLRGEEGRLASWVNFRVCLGLRLHNSGVEPVSLR